MINISLYWEIYLLFLWFLILTLFCVCGRLIGVSKMCAEQPSSSASFSLGIAWPYFGAGRPIWAGWSRCTCWTVGTCWSCSACGSVWACWSANYLEFVACTCEWWFFVVVWIGVLVLELINSWHLLFSIWIFSILKKSGIVASAVDEV